ncbi:MAG: ImmA/IrrE family metallo-endopeptidase [Lachnospiraceae bacterium]|nr:ImmA/IrrE family metallo-endopeptidase [Lachnospiraceae bacterium]
MFPSGFMNCIINGVKIEQIVVERVFCDLDNKTDLQTMNEWVYHIGVCVSKGKYYLCLEGNDQNLLFSIIIDEKEYEFDNIKELSFDEANEIIDYLQLLGAEKKGELVPQFSKMMLMIMNSVPFHICFEPCDTHNGIYNKKTNTIIIANNQSQLSMMFALLHEVTHCLCHSNRCSPRRADQYLNDKEENICNATAIILLDFILNSPLGMTTDLWDQNRKDIIEIHINDNYEKYNKHIGKYVQEAGKLYEKLKKGNLSDYQKVLLSGLEALLYCKKHNLMTRVFYYVLRIMKQMAKVKLAEPVPEIPQSELYCISLSEEHKQFIHKLILPKMKIDEYDEGE